MRGYLEHGPAPLDTASEGEPPAASRVASVPAPAQSSRGCGIAGAQESPGAAPWDGVVVLMQYKHFYTPKLRQIWVRLEGSSALQRTLPPSPGPALYK